MATTEDRLAGVEDLEKLYEHPPATPPQTHSTAETTAKDSPTAVSTKDARRLLIAWAVVMGAIFLLEPQADNADAVAPMWAEVSAVGLVYSLIGTMFGLSARRPWALGASMLAVGFGAVLAIACAATGHHVGLFWAYELAAFAVLGALTLGAARRAR